MNNDTDPTEMQNLATGPTTHLICTDMDRTLIPNGPQEEDLLVRARFANIFKQDNIKLTYVSGRSLTLVEQGIEEYQLPRPNFVIADVGSSIYHATEDGWLPDKNWHELIATDWQNKSWQSLLPYLEIIPDLELQDNQLSENCPHKLSFFTPPTINSNDLQFKVEKTLSENNFKSRAVWSLDEKTNKGLLDILPASVSKLHSIEFLLRQLNLKSSQCLFCGDSGNDLEALQSHLPSVLVANALPEVRRQAIQNSKRLNNEDKLYLAQLQSATNNGNYAGGILQGIEFFFPELYCSELGGAYIESDNIR